jgi:hypothetical protein
MTATPQSGRTGLREFVLVKRGLYYAPNNQGYTGILARAGRYLESDADRKSGVIAVHENDAPMFSEACWNDVKAKYLLGEIADRDKRLALHDTTLAAMRERVVQLEAALIRIAEVDWYTRYPHPKPHGGVRGKAGMIACFALIGESGSFHTNGSMHEKLRATLQSRASGGEGV